MVRTQLQIDDDTYEALRESAHRQKKSMSALVRSILRDHLTTERTEKVCVSAELKKKYPFICMGSTIETDISIRHDDYLAEDFLDIP